MNSTYLEHLERHLGPIGQKIVSADPGARMGFQILSFQGKPFTESTTIVTAGLGGHVMRQASGREIRQELVVCSYRENADVFFAGVIERVARQLVDTHVSLQRGQVIGPRGPLVKGSALEAVVCCSPWYWEESFSRFDGLNPPVMLVWLVPISPGEAEYIRRFGIDAFEVLLAAEEPDLLDLNRSELPIGL